MNAIHIIMATSNSPFPHLRPNARIQSLASRRRISAITFLIFGILLVIAGSLMASFQQQRFSVSVVVFGGISIIFAFMYWLSAEKILIALRKLDVDRIRQEQLRTQNSGTVIVENVNGENHMNALRLGLPSYEQSIHHRIFEIPPPYEEAVKSEVTRIGGEGQTATTSTDQPIRSISFEVSQGRTNAQYIPTTLNSNCPVTVNQ